MDSVVVSVPAPPVIKVTSTMLCQMCFSWERAGGGNPPVDEIWGFGRRTPWGSAGCITGGVSYYGPPETLALLNAAIEDKTGIPPSHQLIFYRVGQQKDYAGKNAHDHVFLCPKTAKRGFSLHSHMRISEETDLAKLHREVTEKSGQDVFELHLMAIWPSHCSQIGAMDNSDDRDQVAAFYRKRCVGTCTCGGGAKGT